MDNDGNAGSIASAPYTAKGYIETKQAEYTSTRFIYSPYIATGGGSSEGEHYYPPGSGYTLKNGSWVSNRDINNFNKTIDILNRLSIVNIVKKANRIVNQPDPPPRDDQPDPSNPANSDPTGGTWT